MLQSIRDKTQGWIAKLILGAVCVTFALWGIHNYFTGVATNTVVAKVNGAAITNQQLLASLRQIQNQQAQAQGSQAAPSAAALATQKQLALDQLIAQQLAVQQLAKLHLATPDSVLQQLLEQMPMFQENGQFSITRYQQLLASQGISSAQFIGELKQRLEATQLQQGVVYSNFALPSDVDKFIAIMNETRQLGYILIPPSHFKAAPVSDAVIEAYYQAHQSEFMQPPQVSLAYVQLSLADVTSQLIQEGMSPAQAKQAAPAKLAALSDSLTNLAYEQPTSLDPLVKQLHLSVHTTPLFSQTSTEQSGILADANIRAAAFAGDVYDQNYNSQVIQLDDGSQVVLRILAKKPEAVAPLETVKAKITAIVQMQVNHDAAQQLASKIAADLSSGQSGPAVAANYQLAWQEKSAATRHEPGVNDRVVAQVFSLPAPKQATKPSVGVIPVPNGDIAVVAVYQVKVGEPQTVSTADKQAFANQIALNLGQIDFALYMAALRDKANIRIYPTTAS